MNEITSTTSRAGPSRGVRFLLSTLPAPASAVARAGRVGALAVATVGPLAAAFVLLTWNKSLLTPFVVPSALLALSAALAHHGRAGSQILARSVWWANLVLGALFSLAGGGDERTIGLLLVLTTGGPLLAMGRLGLDHDDDSAFRPVAFRTTLTVGMTMAVADAQALLFWGILKLENDAWSRGPLSQPTQGAILLLAAAMILVAIAGLYRLRVWGLLLAALCSVGLIGLAATDVCGLETPLPEVFIATSLVQLLLPAPIVAAILRGRAPAPRAASRLARLAPAFVVAAVVGGSAAAVLGGYRLR